MSRTQCCDGSERVAGIANMGGKKENEKKCEEEKEEEEEERGKRKRKKREEKKCGGGAGGTSLASLRRCNPQRIVAPLQPRPQFCWSWEWPRSTRRSTYLIWISPVSCEPSYQSSIYATPICFYCQAPNSKSE
ncbi:hypothetical protein M0804_001950 [Polistes exclamans]|nr:hypothetical protein M0804_001950 [Polistes exclamans]